MQRGDKYFGAFGSVPKYHILQTVVIPYNQCLLWYLADKFKRFCEKTYLNSQQ